MTCMDDGCVLWSRYFHCLRHFIRLKSDHSLPLSIITLMMFAKVETLQVDLGGSVGVYVPWGIKRDVAWCKRLQYIVHMVRCVMCKVRRLCDLKRGCEKQVWGPLLHRIVVRSYWLDSAWSGSPTYLLKVRRGPCLDSAWLTNIMSKGRRQTKRFFKTWWGGVKVLIFCEISQAFFLLETSKNAMEHMINEGGGDLSDHFLMLWLQKY